MEKKSIFKYHPNIYENDIITKEIGVCQCCEKTVSEYCNKLYAIETVRIICLECVANGKAAEKFDGQFIQDAEIDKVDDPSKSDELFNKTPGYRSWQGENWLACCNDFCAFIGDVGTKELEEMGIDDEVLAEHEEVSGYFVAREYITKKGNCAGYLFQCLHCKKYHLGVDGC